MKTIKTISFPALTMAAALMAGCALAPKHERPASPVSATWPEGARARSTDANSSVANVPWEEFFHDARLKELIRRGLENNRDLRVAALRAEQARAQFRIQRSSLFPQVDASGTAVRQRTPETISRTGDATTLTTYDVSLGAAFEVDLFGRVRSLRDQALQQYLAAEASQRSVQISLIAEIATQYLSLLEWEESVALAQRTLDAVQSSYDLNRRSYEGGAASELDLRTAEGQVQTARLNLLNFQQLAAQTRNALELLIGEPIGDDVSQGGILGEQRLLEEAPAGLPSELLARRPDIIAAEHALKAANANIGAARAAFFPRILLTGAAGFASFELSDLFTGPAAAWNFAPQISVPIFNAGRNRANLDVARLQKEVEIATYERAIQSAFREVADALAARAFIDEKLVAQRLLAEAQQRRFDLTEARYRQGVDSYLDVLLAQQALYSAQQGLVQFRAARLLNAVTLYRVLGGGWGS